MSAAVAVAEWLLIGWGLIYAPLTAFVLSARLWAALTARRRRPRTPPTDLYADPVAAAEAILADADRFVDWDEKGWME